MVSSVQGLAGKEDVFNPLYVCGSAHVRAFTVETFADAGCHAGEDLLSELNSGGLLLEIQNTYARTAYFLALARGYRDVEPQERWYYCHFRKISALNLSVFYLSKIQDLVVRLLYETFGGDLIEVDHNDPEWERYLTMQRALRGLQSLRDKSTLDEPEYAAIISALGGPAQSAVGPVVMNYRRRLAHRITPSIDHAETRAQLQNRRGEPSYDEHGNLTSISWPIGTISDQPEYAFDELYNAITEYLHELARMLTALKRLPRFS